jgi:outer membrane protein assembly factor BamB
VATEALVTIVDLDIAARPSARARGIGPSRPTALLVIGLLTLLAVAASAPPAPPLVHALWSAAYDPDDDTVTLTPTSLYLYRHGAGAPALTAYDLATGAPRWSAPAAGAFAQSPSVADGVLVAPDGYEQYFNRPDLLLTRTTRTIARDAQTGATLWRAAGAPQYVTDQSVLLADADTGGVHRLREVGLHDGRTRWSRPAPGLSDVVVVGDAVVTATAGGRLDVLGYDDGAIIRTAKVPWSPDASRLSAAAGVLVVTGPGPAGRTNAMYRPDTLAPLWRVGGTVTDCGAVLCGADAGGLTGHDPDTGTRRWQVPGMTVAWPLRADRIIASSELTGQFQLLDPATGTRLGTVGTGLGSWRTDGRSAVDGDRATPYAFVLRGVTGAAGRTAVVRLDLRTGDPYPLGAIDGTGWIGCRAVTGYLLCVGDSRVTVIATG